MIEYSNNDNIVFRFISHYKLGTQSDLSEYYKGDVQPNLIERIGDVGLWMLENIPRKVWQMATEPRVVTIALTAMTLFSITLAFYPVTTYLATYDVVVFVVTNTPFWAVKLAVYIALVETTIAKALRAYGRFSNQALMDKFYQPQQNTATNK